MSSPALTEARRKIEQATKIHSRAHAGGFYFQVSLLDDEREAVLEALPASPPQFPNG